MNQKGFAPIIATFVILVGIVLAVYLSTHQQIFRPHAASDVTRAEFVDSNGNVISQTSSRNVIVKLTYVPQVLPPANSSSSNGGTVTVPGGSVSVSGSSTVTQTGNGTVNVQFSGPSASVGGGSATSSSSHTETIQNTTTVTQNGQTTTTTTSSGNPISTSADQFPSNFRIANSLPGLNTASSQAFTQNEQQVNWLLDPGDGLKQIFVQFEVSGSWQAPINSFITLNSTSATQNTPIQTGVSNPPQAAGTAHGTAFFVLQQGAAVQVSTDTTNGSTNSGTNTPTVQATPVGTSVVTGGTTQNGVPQGGKITLPNGQVIQGGNGTGTNGIVPGVKGVSTITQIPVKLSAESDSTAANLFNAKLVFDPSSLQVAWVDTQGSFVTNWVANTYDNSTGVITLTGGVPSPGIQTSGSAKLMATVYFVPLKSNASTVSLDPSSAIYSNADNSNIISTSQSLSVTPPNVATPPIIVVTPPSGVTPAPSFVPTPQPTSTNVTGGTTQTPPPTPIATQVIFTGPSASVPGNSSSSTSSSTCTIDQTHFVTTDPSVPSGSVVTVTVTGSTSCNGQTVNFAVAQNNGVLGSQPVSDPPPAAKFNGDTATSTWVTKSNDGVLGGVFGPSGYSLTATLPQSNQSITSNQDLKVTKQLIQGFKKGDINHDGSITLEDLSAFFSNFLKSNAPSEADINNDGKVNAFDFSSFVALLKQQGVVVSGQ